jgi:hypothetical protein
LQNADAFIAEACATTARDPATSHTLFEMLLPNRLKELAPEARDVVLLLDANAARYPWELLEDRWGHRAEPQSVSAGMLRQLIAANYREWPRRALGKRALAVGNPLLPDSATAVFPPLPGARDEADAVARTLKTGGFAVESCLDAGGEEILKRLYGDAWRILHLAGHGVHEYEVIDPHTGKSRLVSGMVLGLDSFLTPGDVRQMRFVPELVFINCCYLGATVASGDGSRQFPAMAANLAVQFIEMGVRAVIAAGWAVDDRAAEIFATTFYRHMTAGESFGRAIHEARCETYRQCPQVNTFGAYQCYGDPDFRVMMDGGRRPETSRAYVSPRELIVDLDNLATVPGDAAKSAVDACLAAIPEAERDAWLARSDVATAVGLARGQSGDYADAITFLRRAAAAPDGDIPVHAVEKLANWTVRLSARKWADAQTSAGSKKEKTETMDTAEGEVENAVKELTALVAMGGTTERLSMLGSAWKHLAWMRVRDAKARSGALTHMRDYYDEADQLAAGSDPYPKTNAAAADLLLAYGATGSAKRAAIRAALARCKAALALGKSRVTPHADFWTLTAVPDCEALIALAGPVKSATAAMQKVRASYADIFRIGGTANERCSVLEHLDFLIVMARAVGMPNADALALMREQLAG